MPFVFADDVVIGGDTLNISQTLVVDGSNVGIGTGDPQGELDVRGDLWVGYDDVATTAIVKTFSVNHADNHGGLTLGTSDGSFAGMDIRNIDEGAFNSQEIDFHTHWGGVNAGARMRIDKDGNVGIGTLSPTDRLQVNGAFRLGIVTNEDDGSGVELGQPLYFSGGNDYATWNSDNSDPLWIRRANILNDDSELRVNIGDGADAGDGFVVGHTGTGGWVPTMRVQPNGLLSVQEGDLRVVRSGTTAYPNIHVDTVAATGGSHIIMRRGLGTDVNNPLGVTTGANLGVLSFRGHDGTAWNTLGSTDIRGYATETFSPSARGADLRFYTTPTGTTALSEYMRIGNNGVLTFQNYVSCGRLETDASGNVLCATGGSGSGLWNDASPNIYYTAGNVGIGEANPIEPLHITNIGPTVNPDIVLEGGDNRAGALKLYDQSNGISSAVNLFAASDSLSRGIQFNTGGEFANTQAKMVIMANGNVGIGTRTPSDLFEVSEETEAHAIMTIRSGDGSPSQISAIDFANAGIKEWGIGKDASNNFFIDEHGVGNRMTILPGGNIGIGTSTPARQFHIRGSGSNNRFRLEMTGTASPTIEIGKDPNYSYIFHNVNTNNLFLRTDSASEHIIMQQGGGAQGNVGIGTSNPTDKLYLNVDSGNAIQTVDSASAQIAAIDFANAGTKEWGIGKGTTNNFFIDEHGVANRLTIEAGGDVGVGITDPVAQLHVDGANPMMRISGTSDDLGDLTVLHSNNNQAGVGYSAVVLGVNLEDNINGNNMPQLRKNWGGVTGAGAIYMGADEVSQGVFGVLGTPQTTSPGTELSHFLTVRGDGDVGIGTVSPAAQLHVHESADINNQLRLTTLGRTLVLQTPGGGQVAKLELTGTSGDLQIHNQGAGGSGDIYLMTNDQSRITIDNSGTIALPGFTNCGALTTDASNHLQCGAGNGLWIPTGNDIRYSGGHVSIGTTRSDNIFEISNAFSFHDGGHEVFGVGFAAGINSDLDAAGYSGELRLDTTNGWMGLGTSSSVTTNPQNTLFLTANDRVGVNTANPLEELHILGPGVQRLRVESTDSQAGVQIQGNLGEDWVIHSAQNDRDLRFWQATGGNRMVIEDGGNVGIGTIDPEQELHVQGSGDTRILLDTTSSTQDAVFTLRANGDTSHMFHDSATNDLYIRTDSSSQDIILQTGGSQGFVGIGTTTPTAKLYVQGDGTSSQGLLKLVQQDAPTGTSGDGAHIIFGDTANLQRGWIGFFDQTWHGGGTVLNLKGSDGIGFAANGIGASAQMFLESTGELGIGTTTPSEELHVVGDIAWGGASSQGRLTSDMGSSIELGGAGNPYIDFKNNAVDFDARLQLTGDDDLWLSGADFGIGDSTPDYALDVSDTGNQYAVEIQDSSNVCQFGVSAGGWVGVCQSDLRLKENIRDAQPVLDKLLKVQVRDFELKSDGSSDTGFIAQEYQEVFPEKVILDDDGYYRVETPNTVELLQAIQEQQAIIEDQQAQIDQLRKDVEALK